MSRYISYSGRASECLPSLDVFLRELMENIFPGIEAKSTEYLTSCIIAFKEAKLLDENMTALDGLVDNYIIEENSNIFRLMYELNESYKVLVGKKEDITIMNFAKTKKIGNYPEVRLYKALSMELKTFCQDTKTFDNWLQQKTKNTSKYFVAAVFFSYLLLTRDACRGNVLPFTEKCLGYFGIKISSDVVRGAIDNIGFEARSTETEYGNTKFRRLASKAPVIVGTALLACFHSIGKSDEEINAEAENLYELLEDTLRYEELAQSTVNISKRNLCDSLSIFEPRSIDSTGVSLPSVFVMPKFTSNNDLASPTEALVRAKYSRRMLMVSPTGLGKSVYLQMLALCSLRDEFCEKIRTRSENASRDVAEGLAKTERAFYAIAERMALPKDLFVIHIPARMFSTLYSIEEYKEYTTDLVEMYFFAVCRLLGRYHFYTHSTHIGNDDDNSAEIRGELFDYVEYLAKKGRLLLILDSFDEIPAGEMRNAYLTAAGKFRSFYCNGGKNAHILLATRKMSSATMEILRSTVDASDGIYSICELCEEDRRELIENWSLARGSSESVEDVLYAIRNNHIREELARTPYMLSVLYWNLSRNTSDIISGYISTLTEKIISNHSTESGEFIDLLSRLSSSVIPSLALESVKNNSPVISAGTIREAIRGIVSERADTYIDEGEIKEAVDKLFNATVTQVGLIVPADDTDDAFRFIADIIRYHLAAARLPVYNRSDDVCTELKRSLLDGLDLKGYVRVMVMLLSREDYAIGAYKSLALELSFKSFKDESENELLTEAVSDILLGNYALSYATASRGSNDELIKQIQRMLLSRLLTSGALTVSDETKKRLLESPSWKNNSDFFSDVARASLLSK